MAIEKKFDHSKELFEKINHEYPAYSPEAKYYSAFVYVKKNKNITKSKHDEYNYIKKLFEEARIGFEKRLYGYYTDRSIIEHYRKDEKDRIFKTDAFTQQQLDLAQLMNLFMESIDSLLGGRIDSCDFMTELIPEEASHLLYQHFTDTNIFKSTPIMGTSVKSKVEREVIQRFCQQRGVPWENVFNELNQNKIVNVKRLTELMKPATAEKFWEELKSKNLIEDVKTHLLIDTSKFKKMNSKLMELIEKYIVEKKVKPDGLLEEPDRVYQYSFMQENHWKEINAKSFETEIQKSCKEVLFASGALCYTKTAVLKKKEEKEISDIIFNEFSTITKNDLLLFGIPELEAGNILEILGRTVLKPLNKYCASNDETEKFLNPTKTSETKNTADETSKSSTKKGDKLSKSDKSKKFKPEDFVMPAKSITSNENEAIYILADFHFIKTAKENKEQEIAPGSSTKSSDELTVQLKLQEETASIKEPKTLDLKKDKPEETDKAVVEKSENPSTIKKSKGKETSDNLNEILTNTKETPPKIPNCFEAVVTDILKQKFAFAYTYRNLQQKLNEKEALKITLPTFKESSPIFDLLDMGIFERSNINLNGLNENAKTTGTLKKAWNYMWDSEASDNVKNAAKKVANQCETNLLTETELFDAEQKEAKKGKLKKIKDAIRTTFKDDEVEHYKEVVNQVSIQQFESLFTQKAPAEQKIETLDAKLISLWDKLDQCNLIELRSSCMTVLHGATHLISLHEQKWSWKTIGKLIAVGIAATVQLVVGGVILVCSGGSGVFVSNFFISEGISDLIYTIKGACTGYADNYKQHKIMSVIASGVLCGVGGYFAKGAQFNPVAHGIYGSGWATAGVNNVALKGGALIAQATLPAVTKEVLKQVGRRVAAAVLNLAIFTALQQALKYAMEAAIKYTRKAIMNKMSELFEKLGSILTLLKDVFTSFGLDEGKKLVNECASHVLQGQSSDWLSDLWARNVRRHES
uniref:Uncharacterized protein n=1 Tax=Panagrolaimus davidi TaxID=227884 RepID=A0A914QMC1_9BILA